MSSYVDELGEELEAKMDEHKHAMAACGAMLKALRSKPPARAAASPKPKAAKARAKPKPISDDEARGLIAGMPQPFTAQQLADKLGLVPRGVGPRLLGWERSGLVHRVGDGQWAEGDGRTTRDEPQHTRPMGVL